MTNTTPTYDNIAGVNSYSDLVMKTCMTAGSILIENGSEMERVYGTVKRIAANAGMPHLQLYANVTSIMVSENTKSSTQIEEIDKRCFNLRKITVVNDLSRQFAAHKITLPTFYKELQKVDKLNNYYPYWMKLAAAGLLSGAIEVVFMGDYRAFFVTCFVGMVGWFLFDFLNDYVKVEFINDFVAAIAIALLALLSHRLGWTNSVDNVIIGALMPLVPGVQITNAVRDLMSGNVISGPARGIEAIMCAIALGFGVALVLKVFA